ncbi:hypothetical protein ACTL6P_14835 [Endozoicomonas acroporae]|uniref:hypothetical protein n=1 Tax=Endozoicomonas acroporae TaxID=1701104 RepID=UPI000C7782BF|nr:hypothetical protein [Endozoicomonas acroporae]
MSIPQQGAGAGSPVFNESQFAGDNYHPVTALNGQFSGMMVRVVNASKEAGSGNQYRPISLLRRGSRYALTTHHKRFDEFLMGSDRVLTILKPARGCDMRWAFKQDVASDANGEPKHLHSKRIKKMTSWDVLTTKMDEWECRWHSLFDGSPFRLSSGHIGKNGYLLHKAHPTFRTKTGKYPEIICQINFDRMHYGYLLDFGRELSFRRIEEVMGNILTLEQKKGNLSGGEFREPVKLCLFNSFQGVVHSPVTLSRAQVQQLQYHTHAFSRYGSVIGYEHNLYQLLSQSGCERFLKLLANIPQQVSTVAVEFGEENIDINALLTAIEHYDSAKFMTGLSTLDDRVKSPVGLPNLLMEALIRQCPIKEQFPGILYDGADNTYEHRRVKLSWDYLLQQTKSHFAAQAVICRELLKHNLFVPLLSGSPECSGVSHNNPLVCCLLIAHGTRVHLTPPLNLPDCTLLISAKHFRRANLLTADEADIIRHEMLWSLLCQSDDGPVTDPDEIISRLSTLKELLLRYHDNYRRKFGSIHRHQMVDELFGMEFYYRFVVNRSDNGGAVREFLEQRLSPRSYSDEKLRAHLELIATRKSSVSDNVIMFLGKAYCFSIPAVVRSIEHGANQLAWLEAFLASPPTFEGRENLPDSRYGSITQVVGQHYYQFPHPYRAQTILAEGIQPFYRKWHGLDHALRTQLATEFLMDQKVLPHFHKPFRELLLKHPQLLELLPIAELYHDAVAEDEHKEVEELRAAELFQRDMTGLQQYPGQLVTLVASALRNKNCKMIDMGNPSFIPDQQCPEDELLLRQVLRFGDIVDILRVKPPREDFPTIKLSTDSAAMDTLGMIHDGHFHPEMIELLAVVNNPQFTLLIQSALLSFRDLASITGGWHHQMTNPFTRKYHLPVDNHKRRLLIEQAPDPYQCLRECLDDLVRFVIAEKAGISACFAEHPRPEDSRLPDCWDPGIGSGGAYRSLHNEEELRQIKLPEAMTLADKIIVAADQPGLEDRISAGIPDALQAEALRLQHEAILPAVGTPTQSELEQMLLQPDSPGARLLNERGYIVKSRTHEGRVFYQMVPNSGLARDSLLLPPQYDDKTTGPAANLPPLANICSLL